MDFLLSNTAKSNTHEDSILALMKYAILLIVTLNTMPFHLGYDNTLLEK